MKKKILLVEDEQDLSVVFNMVLEDGGYEVEDTVRIRDRNTGRDHTIDGQLLIESAGPGIGAGGVPEEVHPDSHLDRA